jgi:hypothetical protein
MTVSEKEARTKWCPFARVATCNSDGGNPSAASPNRISLRGSDALSILPSGALCVGSDCMAWRVPMLRLDKHGFAEPNAEREGYCGLAGKE